MGRGGGGCDKWTDRGEGGSGGGGGGGGEGGHCTHLACFLRNRKSSVEPPSPPVTQLAEFDDGHVSALLWQPLGKDKHPDVMSLLLHRHRSSSDLL